MKQMIKKLICLSLCLIVFLSLPVAVYAQELASAPAGSEHLTQLVHIKNEEQFLEFAENCRLNQYSANVQVNLWVNLDLSGLDFSGVPSFSGVFCGGGHTISGLSITADGSYMGLFRYLTESAVVADLYVEGVVAPGGSASFVGGIAGQNAGKIENCSFTGTVSGLDYVGGLVGSNTVTGIIENCGNNGTVTGNHFAGGFAGENLGVIRNCKNRAAVNTTDADNSLSISDITLESITGAESAVTTTDIGGIAGRNVGVIRSCRNRGQVGYRQMGYNVGGICGSSVGLVAECENYGQVLGRKEVGGIVGHLIPATQLEFTQDALQQLEGELDTLSGLTGGAGFHAQSGIAGISGQVSALKGHVQTAKDAVSTLLPKDDPDSVLPELPDMDSVIAAQNNISASVQGMQDSAGSITSGLENTLSTLSKDMQAITGQIGVIGSTMKSARENLGGSLTDVSDLDTDEDVSGKITGCVNYADVLGDWNVGGITGAMAPETQLDQEDNLDILGESSLHFDGQIRVVVTDSQNHGQITGKKQCVGGIAGRQTLGLIRNCQNTGLLDGAAAEYVGGIAGQSAAVIRSCQAKCQISGLRMVGGIAGSGDTVTGCLAMSQFENIAENQGQILGAVTESLGQTQGNITENYYVVVDKDYGGIDGISYEGVACAASGLLGQLEEAGEMFRTATVYFITDNSRMQTVSVPVGGALTADKIPALLEKEGYKAQWEGLEAADLSCVNFDLVFRASYIKQISVAQSDDLRDDGRALFLAQGQFEDENGFAVTDLLAEYDPSLLHASVLEVWGLTIPDNATIHTLRFALPQGVFAEDVELSVLDTVTGSYKPVSFTVNGSYLVFQGENVSAVKLTRLAPDYSPYYLMGGGIFALALAIAIAAVILHRRKKAKAALPADA